MPSVAPPSAVDCTSSGGSPPGQRWKKLPATLSPTFTRVTAAPISIDFAGAVGQRNDVFFDGMR